ncbi:VOC family protein [Amnibacterium sp.]|uniref:VOC family protein n=1 Tax=Amnibacterium sp. TaxID=1872496 RepID=UPI00260C1D53|nr:VOC family protein [Amnibacterium sp.]MCU1473148.1 glyoxalase [Amnibacterium sp.]
MLTEAHTILPAADLTRFRGYYHDTLGLDPSEEHDGMLVYGSGPAAFEVYETENVGTAKNTQMVWTTDDLDAEMARLRSAGVVFEEFEIPGMSTDKGVVETAEMRSAWFRDSEGNILCVSERR